MITNANMSEHTKPPDLDSDANFLGWQRTLSGELFPLFNITVANHPLYHSTVSEETLRRLRLRVPRVLSPYPETKPSPWHNLGIELNYPKTAREAIEMAGLDYIVVKKPRELKTGLNQNAYATVRTDTDEVLGFVNESYTPIQNINAFTFFDTLVAENEAVYETAGFFGKGEFIWILAKLPGYINVHGNDIVNKYLLLTNSHDGSSQVRVKLTPIRVVCNNTLTSALQGAGDIQIIHTPNAARDLEQATTTLVLSKCLYEQLDVKFNCMAARKVTQEQLREYVQALVPDNEETENTARTEKIRNSVLQLHDSGLGAHLARGTLWGAFNSVAEYTDHMMLGEDSATRLDSIWFGRGEQLKLKAFHLAQRMMM
ncbi:mycobacteriophage barnyard protein gp56 [hydrocarbon metagenome]|uniref:Mycobacteriophage barnyard protein gp56 n=1 Tax=hydrocarbon metagenome TaxID=938273 RepID=A0A0W8FRD2_9ZZZZ